MLCVLILKWLITKCCLCLSKVVRALFLINDAREVQGECKTELVRALLSRSLHSPLQLVCDGKGTATFARFQIIKRNLPRVVATGWERNDKRRLEGKILSFSSRTAAGSASCVLDSTHGLSA